MIDARDGILTADLATNRPGYPGKPTNEGVSWPSTNATAGNQAGQNEEPFSYHSGGVNALFGDGSVRFIKNTVNVQVWLALNTIANGEVLSADSY